MLNLILLRFANASLGDIGTDIEDTISDAVKVHTDIAKSWIDYGLGFVPNG